MSYPTPTHDVLNQPSALEDYNSYTSDIPLQEAVAREGGSWATEDLTTLGALLGSAEMIEHGRLANAHPPELRLFDRFGHRVNQVRFHPSYHVLMKTSIENGIAAQPWSHPRAGSTVARLTKSFLMGQVEQGHGCPITMTFAAVPALRAQPEIAAIWEPRVTSWHYDGADKPADQKAGCTLGMFMTEKQGGSDVRTNTTRATPDGAASGPGASYRLVGHKWFCSAPMSDAFLTLAHTDKGLSCFLVPRWHPDGTRNPMWIQRLKDKVGNRSNASSEIEYLGAWAQMVGEEGRGVRTIIDMVQHTRLDCVAGSASQMRHAVAQAVHHTRHRETFGKPIVQHPAMANLLADLQLESEAATAVMLRLGRAYDEAHSDPEAKAFARIATAISKYHICKRCPSVLYEAMEAHGGNGYVDDGPMGRLYRDAPLNSIWEGSGNVIALDVLRAMSREPDAVAAFHGELSAAMGADRRYDAWVQQLMTELADTGNLELRARRLVERMALAFEASLLMRGAPSAVSDAFLASRIADDHGSELGTLPAGLDYAALIVRGGCI